VALSATVYADLRRSRSSGGGAARPALVAFGDPRFPRLPDRESLQSIADERVRSLAERGFAFDPLPASRAEVEGIARLYEAEATAYLGEAATEERAKSAAAGSARILHFATHATLDPDLPLNSALVFTLPERFSEGRDNGLLQAWEIFEGVRFDADLVVLSACDSGLGKELGGDGLLGLTRAFHYAGARSVAASLWKVSDRTTGELMVRFHRHLRSGKSKDEALRAAQLELLRGPIRVRDEQGRETEIDASSPYYWAAFQIFGDWR
jgi:CHAT domain-containing protein